MHFGNVEWRASCILVPVLGTCGKKESKISSPASRDVTGGKHRHAWLAVPQYGWCSWGGVLAPPWTEAGALEILTPRGETGLLIGGEDKRCWKCWFLCVYTSPSLAPYGRCVRVSLKTAVTLRRALPPLWPHLLPSPLLPLRQPPCQAHQCHSFTLAVPSVWNALSQIATYPSPPWVSILRPPYQRGHF